MSTQIAPTGAPAPAVEIQPVRTPAQADKSEIAAHATVAEPANPSKVDLKSLQKIVQEAIETLNEQMRQSNRSLNFSMDAQVNRVVITVRNTDSGEVVRQIPDEAILRVAHNLQKVRGLLLNEEV